MHRQCDNRPQCESILETSSCQKKGHLEKGNKYWVARSSFNKDIVALPLTITSSHLIEKKEKRNEIVIKSHKWKINKPQNIYVNNKHLNKDVIRKSTDTNTCALYISSSLKQMRNNWICLISKYICSLKHPDKKLKKV